MLGGGGWSLQGTGTDSDVKSSEDIWKALLSSLLHTPDTPAVPGLLQVRGSLLYGGKELADYNNTQG